MATASRIPTNRISSYLLFATVALAPLPFGSTDQPVVVFWCIVLGVGVLVASTRGLRREHFGLLGLAAIVILAYVFVLHEQLAVRPWIASPQKLWRDAADALGASINSSVSIARNQPLYALGAPLANMLAVTCGAIVCVDRDRAHQLLLVIAWSGAVYALYGIVTYLIDPTHILWRPKLAYRDVLTSTFVNRNTAATYFGSCSILWLLLLSQYLRRRLPPGPIQWRGLPAWFLSEMPRPALLAFAMLVLCVAAMLITNSRAGVVLSLMALVAAFAMFFSRDLSRRGGIVTTLIVSGFVALLLLHILGGSVSGRFEAQGLSDEGRVDVYRSTIKMIADHPWFGTGLGTFAWAFPAYRSANISSWGVWDRAHSTPLELASDLGLPLTVLIVLAWLIVLAILVRGVLVRRRDVAIPVGALATAGLALAHSLIDFSLQIPGYAIIVFALVGAGLSQSFSSNSTEAE